MNDKILAPSHFDKMSVQFAMAVFSYDVSNGLKYLVEKHNYSKDLLTTAWFIKTIRRWFDLANSRNPSIALSRQNMEKYEEAITFLQRVISVFKDLKVGSGEKANWKPSQTGVIMATTTLLHLQDVLLGNRGVHFFLTSRGSQDALENTFSVVRLKGALPTPKQVKHALKNISISQFEKEKKNSSYQHAGCDFMADFLTKKKRKAVDDHGSRVGVESHQNDENNSDEEDNPNISIPTSKPNCGVEHVAQNIGSEQDVVFYIAGHCIKRVPQQYVTCNTCVSSLTLHHDDIDHMSNAAVLTILKDWTGKSLIYCKTSVFENVFMRAELIFRKFVSNGQMNGCGIKARLVRSFGDPEVSGIPGCHKIVLSLVKQYFKTRLHCYGKQEKEKALTTLKKKRSGHERSSKSLQMRKSVSNLS